MPADKFGQPPPIVQSMILADYIHRDSTTGKHFILGTYNQIAAVKFPSPPQKLSVYIVITDAHGPTVVRVRIVDVDEAYAPIHDSSYPIDLPDPNRPYELTFNVNVVFPAAGDYRIQLFAGDEVLRELRLRIIPRPRPQAPEEP